MSFLIEFWEFLRVRKKYWLLPIIIVLVLFGGLIILSQGSAVAPFIYTLFQFKLTLKNISKSIKIFISLLIVIFFFEILVRLILFIPTNIDVFKYGFKKSVVFEVVDLSKLQINIIDKNRNFKKSNNQQSKNKSNIAKIWIFGGSTTYGYNCDSSQSSSWPEEMFKINKNFNFQNFAFNGANSDQSIILLWKNIVENQPKIILWAHKFNMLNVIGNKNYRNKEILKYEFSETKKNNFFLKVKRLDKSLKDYSLFYSLIDKIIYRISNSLYQKKLFPKIEIKPSNTDIKYAVKNFEINTLEAIEIARKTGVKEFYLISLFSEEDFFPYEESIKYNLYDQTIIKIEKLHFPYVKIIDVNIGFNGVDKDKYLCDTSHQTYEGNKLQANIIYKDLMSNSDVLK